MDGEVIGINVAIRQGAQQIGFAIPIDDARITISRLLNSKRLGATYHGLALEDIKNGVQRELQVAGVESGSPADQSGFRDGDVILQAGSLHTIDQADWERALLGRKPGEKLAVIVRRSGSDTALTLELSRASGAPAKNPTQVVSQESPVEKEESSEDLAWSRIGLTLEQAPVSKLAGQTTYSKGLLISAVRSGSPADRARLEKGDVLVVLQAWRTENLQNLNWVLNHADFATFLPLKCHILRGGKAQYLQLDMNSNVNQMSFKAEQSIATEAWKKLGLKVTVAKPKDLKGQIKYKAGLKVEKVRDKGPASQVHVRPGDIVVVLEDWRMESMSNLGYFLDTDSKEPILIRIVRDGVELYDYLETK